MSKVKKQRMTQVVAHPGLVSWPVEKTYIVDLDATTTRDFPIERVLRKKRLLAASYTQELDVDGDKTVKLRNLTTSVDLTNELDVDALGADAGAAFVLAATLADRDVNPSDLVALVYTVTTAGSVAPGEASVTCEWEYLE